MSSRNRRLSPEERKDAPAIFEALEAARQETVSVDACWRPPGRFSTGTPRFRCSILRWSIRRHSNPWTGSPRKRFSSWLRTWAL